MMDTISNILGWLPWIGVPSIVALAAIAIFAPAVLQVAASWLSALSPLLKGAAEGLVYFVKALWSGVLDMVDNLGSILLVAVVGLGCYLWGVSNVRTIVETRVEKVPCEAQPPTRTREPSRTIFDDIFGTLP